jgi:hypothetical protein
MMAICFGIPQKLEARRVPVAYKMHYSIIINLICNILLLIVIAELQIITVLLL